jgi:adenylyltransferase/sulfurtransferase
VVARVVSSAGQRADLSGPVAIIGCGGLGVPAAWTLALGGVRRLRLIDDDAVERSNLHRQVLYREADVGTPKTEALARALRAAVAGVDVEVCQGRFDEGAAEALLRGCVGLIEGSDDTAAKFIANDLLVRHRRTGAGPTTGVIAAAIGRRGQWMGVDASSASYRDIFEAPPPAEQVASCRVAGVLGPAVGQVGAGAARTLLALLGGRGDPARGALVRVDHAEPPTRRVYRVDGVRH